MPDKWEKKHHLNPRANDARKDPDHDGLSNLSEFRHHTDPQKADTDNDGVNDGTEVEDHTSPTHDDSDEVSGTVVSFSAGMLTIQPDAQGSAPVSGRVTDATEIECEDSPPVAQASDDGSSDDHSGSDDNSGPGSGSGGSDDGDGDDAGDDDRQQAACDSTNLTQGAVVHEAKLMTATDGSSFFTKIELTPAA